MADPLRVGVAAERALRGQAQEADRALGVPAGHEVEAELGRLVVRGRAVGIRQVRPDAGVEPHARVGREQLVEHLAMQVVPEPVAAVARLDQRRPARQVGAAGGDRVAVALERRGEGVGREVAPGDARGGQHLGVLVGEPLELVADVGAQRRRHAGLQRLARAGQRDRAARLRQRPVGEPVVEQVAHEQRVAARALDQHLDEVGRRRRRGEADLEVRRDRAGGQPRERDLLALPPHAEVVHEGGDGRFAVRPGRPERADQQQPGGLATAQQRRDQVERGVVGPVQVLEHQDHRRGGAERVERLEHLAQHPRPRRALGGVADRHAHGPGLEQPRELDQPGRRALRQHADDRVPLRAARELAQRLQHRQVRLDLATVAQALADAQQRARAGLGEEGVDEGALPDARLAADHHRAPAPRLRGGERRAQPRELVVPADRCRALGLDDRRGGRRGERGVVLEDPALERARGVAGREPELAQPRGEPAVGLERLDLAAGAVEREHQRRHELLAQRIGRDQPAQHRHRLERPAERDEGAGALLLRLRAQVLEPAPLGLRPVGVGEVPERRPAP